MLVFATDLFSYYLINMASLSASIPVLTVCSLGYGSISVFVLYYWYVATRMDPSDPTIRAQRLCEAKYERFNGDKYDFMCEVCDTHVLESAKHCGSCNRCVNEFDHHCRWINNCVGSKNYKAFFRLIIGAFLMTLMHNVTNAVVIYHFLSENTEVDQ